MLSIKRFTDFAEIKSVWQSLEMKVFHYPFQSFWYNRLFSETFSKDENIFLLGIYEDDTILTIGAFEESNQTIRFVGMKPVLGKEEVTDFGDLLYANEAKEKTATIWKTILEYFGEQGMRYVQLDYVREDSATYTHFQTRENVKKVQRETSPFIVLPDTWDAYINRLDRKKRHELKRKVSRLEKEAAFHLCKEQTIQEDFYQFVRLHKLSDVQKEKFMTSGMQKFFWDMVTCDKSDWEIHFCSLFIKNQQVASVMAFMNSEQTLLYNSGFDPQYGYFSVGLLVKAFLLKKSIEQRKKIYDFLRGNERYKYDLGAKNMALYEITITT